MRVHEPFTAIDFLNDKSPLHSWTLNSAMEYICNLNVGVVVLLNCSKPPSVFFEHLSNLENFKEVDSINISSTLRNYGFGAAILRDIGVRRMKLLSTPRKMPSMAGFGLEVVNYVNSPKS